MKALAVTLKKERVLVGLSRGLLQALTGNIREVPLTALMQTCAAAWGSWDM